MIITVYVYIKKVSRLPSQLGIFVFTFTVKRLHIYRALLHLSLKVFTFTGPYYIFTFRGATGAYMCLPEIRNVHGKHNSFVTAKREVVMGGTMGSFF